MSSTTIYEKLNRTSAEFKTLLVDWIKRAKDVEESLPDSWETTGDTLNNIIMLVESQLSEFDTESRPCVSYVKGVIYAITRLHGDSALEIQGFDPENPDVGFQVSEVLKQLQEI